MKLENKRWMVEYDHKDGRKGSIEVETEIHKSGAFDYDNGKSGGLTVNGYTTGNDLRYCNDYPIDYNIGESITRRVTKKELLEMIEELYGRGNENNVIAVITETRTTDPYSKMVHANQSITFALPFNIG